MRTDNTLKNLKPKGVPCKEIAGCGSPQFAT